MNGPLISWITEGPTWLQYAVERQLLDALPPVEPAVQDPALAAVIARLRDPAAGLPALPGGSVSYQGPVYWDLAFLADIGLTVEDAGLIPEAESIFTCQQPDGSFLLGRDYKPSYLCIPAILLAALARMGYSQDPRLHRTLDLIWAMQRLDGGWHCAQSRAVGERLQDSESCPMANLNVLMLLGQFEAYREDARLEPALDLLLTHWARRAEPWRPYGFGMGTQFTHLAYPVTKYGILRVLDTLSLFPYARHHPAFGQMLDYVRGKAQDGKYMPESVMRAYAAFDFGQKKAPSRWLTFLLARIGQR